MASSNGSRNLGWSLRMRVLRLGRFRANPPMSRGRTLAASSTCRPNHGRGRQNGKVRRPAVSRLQRRSERRRTSVMSPEMSRSGGTGRHRPSSRFLGSRTVRLKRARPPRRATEHPTPRRRRSCACVQHCKPQLLRRIQAQMRPAPMDDCRLVESIDRPSEGVVATAAEAPYGGLDHRFPQPF